MPSPLPACGALRSSLVLGLSLVPAGCRALGAHEDALRAHAQAPVSYEAEITNGAVRLAELSELDAEPLERVEARADDVLVDLNARLIATTAAAAERAFGWAAQERTAIVVARAAGSERLAGLLAQGDAAEL